MMPSPQGLQIARLRSLRSALEAELLGSSWGFARPITDMLEEDFGLVAPTRIALLALVNRKILSFIEEGLRERATATFTNEQEGT